MSRRDLRLFYLFRMLAAVTLWSPIFTFFQEHRGLDFRDRMLLGGLFSFVVLLVDVPTGALADRVGRKVSLQLGALTMMVSCLFAYFFSRDLPSFMVSETLAALALSLCSGADSAYLYDLLRRHGVAHEYGHRESIASAWQQAGAAIASAAGGLVAYYGNVAAPYLATAGISIIAFAVASLLHEDKPLTVSMRIQVVPHAAMRGWARLMKRSLSELVHNPRLAWLIGYSAVIFTLLRAAQYLYQPYFQSHDFDYRQIGFIFAGVSVLATIIAHHAWRLRRWFGDEPLLWVLLASLAVSFIVLVPVHGPVILVLLGVNAAANGLSSPLVKPLLNNEISDSSRRATILSVENIARRGLTGIFIPIAGFTDARVAMYVAGGLGLTGLAVLALHRQHFARGAAATAAAAERRSAPRPVAAPPLEHQ
ncbi:MAG TPA: MFS transporter [Kofleriaceae bacterium]|nr:MFS transporter [Kofleriaceae bacterium]